MPPAYASYVIGITVGQIMQDQLQCPFLTYDEAIVDIEAAKEKLRKWFTDMIIRLRLQRALRAVWMKRTGDKWFCRECHI